MIQVPLQLRGEGFRFVLIQRGEKKPFEMDWPRTANYRFDDPKLLTHLKSGGNYGVAGGHGDLVILDGDTKEMIEVTEKNLPKTFTVRTGGGGNHYYFLSDLTEAIRLYDEEGENVGDVQGTGKQVVGPGSLHPNGNRYEILHDRVIAKITAKELREAVKSWLVKSRAKERYPDKDWEPLDSISILDVVSASKLNRRGDELQGAHPIHGSTGGQNFCVNPRRGVWHCFRHGSGGGPLEWLAVEHGIIDCAEAVPGALTGETFWKVVKIAEEEIPGFSKEKLTKEGRKKPDRCEETQLGTSLSVRRYSDRACIVRNPGRDNENERIVIDGHFEVLEHLKVDGDDFWRVRQDEESLMNFKGLKTQLEGSSRVLSRRDLPDVLSTILRGCSNVRVSHAAFGVYDHDGELAVCTDPVPVKEEGAKAWEMVKGFVDREATREEVQAYIDIRDYWHDSEILPSLGLGLIAPFAFFLRQNQVLVPHLFNYAPEMDLGKSLVALISSEKLYGYEHTSGPAINSHYRLPSQLDAICLPRTVDEAENLKKELWPALKESAERWLADKRGTPDLGMLDYLSRAILLFTGNSLPISTESVLKRFLVNRFDSSAKLNRKRDSKELEMAYNSLQPIGFQLLRWALEEWPTAEEFLKEFREIEDAIRDAYQQWASPKRPQAWACVYQGLKVLEIGCGQLEMDWKPPSIANFVQDVVQPIETHTWGMRRNHVDRFVDWFDMWRVRQTITVREGEYGESVQRVRGEYEVFKDALMKVGTEEIPGYWITSALLDEFNQRKDGEERVSSLKDLSTQSADLLNLPYALILDKDSKVKTEKLGKKTARVAFIPRDLSGVLSKGLYRNWGDRVTSDEPDSVTHPDRKKGSRVTDEPEERQRDNGHPVTQSSPTPITQSEQSELMQTALKEGTTYDEQKAVALEGGLSKEKFAKWVEHLLESGDIINETGAKKWRWMSK